MVPFALSFLAISMAFLAPSFIGLLIMAGAARFARPRYLAAFSLGIYLWFFSDTMGDSGYLGVSSGFGGDISQIAILVLFATGILIVFSLDGGVLSGGTLSSSSSIAVPMLVAFALGIHGLGEGLAFSATAATTPSTDLLGAFGGSSAAIAFLLHKVLEPMAVGAAYWAYSKDRPVSTSKLLRDMGVLTLVFAAPGIVGGAVNYFLNLETTYAFAFGLGTSIYALITLAKPILLAPNDTRDALKIGTLMLFGLLSIYIAALFHG